ncbi:hypothetical protein HPP92_018508 [Vanilla planifolia]|uniref:Purple acid phosphatase n=1 Tax=Vanilla planifolia TaxID=51239 RepID=A0A835UMH1_VANPL|nr:hypothetical protein HPP92_018508 [Vanilla planifolia]
MPVGFTRRGSRHGMSGHSHLPISELFKCPNFASPVGKLPSAGCGASKKARQMKFSRSFVAIAASLVVAVASLSRGCSAGNTSAFVRKDQKAVDMPLDCDAFRVPPGYNAPQQVHITQGDHDGSAVIVSWLTPEKPGSSLVLFGTSENHLNFSAKGKVHRYKYYNYTSGYIHHCLIRNLKYDTKYYYVVGVGHTRRTFWFITPPKVGPDVPYTFGLIGDLGQSFDSNRTLTHYESNLRKGQTVLFVGDLSYADNYPNHDNIRWDTWGRFIERNAAYQPWIWTAGNHEIDFAPEIGSTLPNTNGSRQNCQK